MLADPQDLELSRDMQRHFMSARQPSRFQYDKTRSERIASVAHFFEEIAHSTFPSGWGRRFQLRHEFQEMPGATIKIGFASASLQRRTHLVGHASGIAVP